MNRKNEKKSGGDLSWRQRLQSAAKKTASNGRAAWEVAKIVRDVWADVSFHEYFKFDVALATEELAKVTGRFALTPIDMLAMIEQFPLLKDWKTGRLDVLRDKAGASVASKAQKSNNGKPRVTRERVTKAQHAKLQEKLVAAETEIKHLRERIKQLERENERLARLADGQTKSRRKSAA